jgi:sperm flagellar protein 1
MSYPPLEEEDIQAVYTWLDNIPLSRPKRNILRDFSDGGLAMCFFRVV